MSLQSENISENISENDELNDEWINEFEKNDKIYQDFYKDDLDYIKIHYIYINKLNNIEKIKEEIFYMSKPNYISREEILGLLKRNSFDSKRRFYILFILKYNITLDAEDINLFLKNKISNNSNTFLTSIKNIDAITFEKSIHMFQDLNDLFFIFHESESDKNDSRNVTKKVYINSNNKKKKTYRK